jgi:putative ABC transport system permease protein
VHDIINAWRQVRRAPGFSFTVILTLALGIGANALVFSAVRGVLLKPLPFPEPDHLVNVWQTQPGQPVRSVAPGNFLDWRAARSFVGLAAYNERRRSLTTGEPERISVATVSANFFDVLDVRPMAGRSFIRTAVDGDTREVMLREDFWRTKFGADTALLNRTVRLDDELFTVVGLIPAHLAFPEDVVAWTQAPHDVPELGIAADIRRIRDARYFRVLGRLRPGVTRGDAQAEMDVIAQRLRDAYPDANTETGINIVDLQQQLTGASARMLWLLFGVVGCLLVIACANVASLLLAAAVSRGRELAVRVALGASRARIVRQLLAENVMLSAAGAIAGLGMAWLAMPALIALMPATMPRLSSVRLDAPVVAFAVVIAFLTAAVFGTVPGLIASRTAVAAGLREGARAGTSKSSVRTASVLVVAQLATALVLITGTGLMLRSLWSLYQRDIGLDIERVLAIDVSLPDAKSRGRAAAVLDVQRMVERLSVLPGVSAAGAIQALPLSTRGPAANLRVDGRVFARNEAPDISWRTVTPDYFRTMGARLVRGRAFTDADREGAPAVAIINRTLATLIWPASDPIGARIGTGLDGDGAPVTIVGIVDDMPQDSLRAAVRPEMFRPLAQPARFPVDAMALVIRTEGDPASVASAVRQAIRDVHPTAPVAAVRTMLVVAASGIATERSAMIALAIFGGLALILASVGLYGVLARLVGDRTRELGIRLALGAQTAHVRWLVLRRTLGLAAVGIVIGAAASVALATYLRAWLYETGAADPLVFVLAAIVLIAAALLASYIPARRASSTDPLEALRA